MLFYMQTLQKLKKTTKQNKNLIVQSMSDKSLETVVRKELLFDNVSTAIV